MNILIFRILGIGIGIIMTSASSGDENVTDSLSSLIMQGLACGTILYVAFFEILERERSKSTVGLIQWTLLVLGFLAIMGLQLLSNITEANNLWRFYN
jgi:zinc transporter 1/2/3